jgi:hypothetical protein
MTRKYSTTSVATTLSASINTTATSMTVAAGTGTALMGGVTLAAGNVDSFAVALDVDTQNEEIVWITQVATDTFTISRGQAGTGTAGVSGIAHTAGASVKHVLTGDDATFFTAGVATADAAIPDAVVTAKGDIIVASASAVPDNLAVGSNNFALVADAAQTLGVKWQNLATRTEALTNKDLTSGTNTFPTSLVTTSGTQTLTNKTIDFNNNTITNLPAANLNLTFNVQTGTTYTIQSSDVNKLVTLNNASAITLTIPNGIFTTGQQVNIQQLGAGQVTIANDGTTSFTGTGTKLNAQYSAATIICTGTNTFTVVGDLI